jgi:hypothetical protein
MLSKHVAGMQQLQNATGNRSLPTVHIMQNKSAVDIEREQEALLVKKYGGLNPLMKRKQPLMPKVWAPTQS